MAASHPEEMVIPNCRQCVTSSQFECEIVNTFQQQMASLCLSLRDLCVGPGAGDNSQEEFLVKGRHVIDKDSFSCGMFNGRLVHDRVPHRVLLGLVGIHTLF